MQLVINSYGASLRKEGDRFLIQAGEKNLSVSAHKVQSILITTGAGLDAFIGFLHTDNYNKKSLVYDLIGRWWRMRC